MATLLRHEGLAAECKGTTVDILAESQQPSGKPVTNSNSQAKRGLAALPSISLDRLAGVASRAAKLLALEPEQPASLADTNSLLEQIDKEIKQTYDKFYEFVYSDLPYCWRQLYTDLSILKFNCLVASRSATSTENAAVGQDDANPAMAGELEELVTELVATMDKALILAGGAGLKRGRQKIERMLALLEEARPRGAALTRSHEGADGRPTKRARVDETSESEDRWTNSGTFSNRQVFEPELKRPIKRVESMSMDAFQRYMDDDGHARGRDGPLPVVIRGMARNWPAMTSRPWRKPDYLLSQTFEGRRLVPVEVGRSYVDDGWGQELIPFKELLRRMDDSLGDTKPKPGCGAEDKDKDGPPKSQEGEHKPVSYLAQHELFTQLPSLRNDIPTPDLCYTTPPAHPVSPSQNKPELPLPLINAWLGPAGTITPLHTDGYHNLLAQVVGAKYVRLYSPVDSEALCPRGEDEAGIDMHNTSSYDVGVIEGWDELPEGEDAKDEIELSEFRELRYWEAVLEEGDVLYIPIGWWHYVRSLSVSFSVSFWWNGDHVEGGEKI